MKKGWRPSGPMALPLLRCLFGRSAHFVFPRDIFELLVGPGRSDRFVEPFDGVVRLSDHPKLPRQNRFPRGTFRLLLPSTSPKTLALAGLRLPALCQSRFGTIDRRAGGCHSRFA